METATAATTGGGGGGGEAAAMEVETLAPPGEDTGETLAGLTETELFERLSAADCSLGTANIKLQAMLYHTLSAQEHRDLMQLSHFDEEIETQRASVAAYRGFNAAIVSPEYRGSWDALRIAGVYTTMKEKLQKIEKDKFLALGDLQAAQFKDPNDAQSAEQKASSKRLMHEVEKAIARNAELGSKLQADNIDQMEAELALQKETCKALINGREELNQFVEELDVQLDSCQTILMSGGT